MVEVRGRGREEPRGGGSGGDERSFGSVVVMVVTVPFWRGPLVVRVELAQESQVHEAEVESQVFLFKVAAVESVNGGECGEAGGAKKDRGELTWNSSWSVRKHPMQLSRSPAIQFIRKGRLKRQSRVTCQRGGGGSCRAHQTGGGR